MEIGILFIFVVFIVFLLGRIAYHLSGIDNTLKIQLLIEMDEMRLEENKKSVDKIKNTI